MGGIAKGLAGEPGWFVGGVAGELGGGAICAAKGDPTSPKVIKQAKDPRMMHSPFSLYKTS